jgi:hypothetical protein
MPEDRLHRPTLDPRAGRTPLWARAIGAGREPPLPRARPRHLEPLRRSWLAAFWQARIAVQARLSLDDFLRSRLARYVAALPVPRTRLPIGVDVEDGQLAVHPSAGAAEPAPARGGEDAWLAALVAVDGPPARREIAELEVELATLEGEIAQARHRVEERGRQLSADVAVGLVAGPPDVEATAEQLGRPPIRSATPRHLALTFAAGALAAETWQVAVPFLAASGLDPASLRAEAAVRPAEVAFAAAFSLGVATGVFALVRAAVDAALALARGDADARRRGILGASALSCALAAGLLAAAVAALRGATPAARLPAGAVVLLLLAVPVAADLVLRAARAGAEARARELDAALAWDRERARSLSERVRRLEELTWAEREVAALEGRRDAARRRLRTLHARAVEAARLAADADRRLSEDLARLAESLVGALELDRYEFIRQASARGDTELLAPRRRKGSDAPAPVPVAVPVAVAVPAPAPEPRLEPAGGRLAS